MDTIPDATAPEARFRLVAMGVSGSGKSVVGAGLAAGLGISFVDGDSLHPPGNVAKMAAGQPLTDADRWPWLARVAASLADAAAYPRGVVIACSALRRAYRDRIRQGAGGAVTFVFLDATPAEVRERMGRRKGHFMPTILIESQFATLERPGADEADVITVGVEPPVDAVVAQILRALRRRDATAGP